METPTVGGEVDKLLSLKRPPAWSPVTGHWSRIITVLGPPIR